MNKLGKRFDIIFSYWIFGWFILYMFKIVTINPLFALLLGLLHNLMILIVVIYNSYPQNEIIAFLIVMLAIKVIPIYLLRNSRIQKRDILTTLCLFLVYLGWIKINGITLKDLKSLYNNKHINTPAVNLLIK